MTTPACSVDRWCWVNPVPVGNGLRGSWAAAPNDVWAVGGAGTILHYNGSFWDYVPGGQGANLNGIWGSSASDIWAVGEGIILHYDGKTWSKSQSNAFRLQGVFGLGPNDIWAVGEATILHYTGAPGWQSVGGLPVGGGFMRAVWASAANDVWVVGERTVLNNGTLLHWNGAAWTQTDVIGVNLHCIWGSGPNDIWVGGDFQGMLHKTTAWAPVDQKFNSQVWAVSGTGPKDAWVTGRDGQMVYWDGVSWTLRSAPVTYYMRSLVSVGPSDVWALGEGGAIEHWDGTLWSDATRGIEVGFWADIHGRSADDIWAVGQGGISAHWDGTRWAKVDTGAKVDLNGVRVLMDGSAWAVGRSGTIMHLQAGVWSGPVAGGTANTLLKIWAASPTAIWAVGEVGTILRYDGTKWAPDPTAPPNPALTLGDVIGFAPNDVWAVGRAPATVLHYNGTTWAVQSKAPSDGGVTDVYTRILIWGTSNKDLWVFGDGAASHWDGVRWAPNNGFNAIAAWGTGPQDFLAVHDLRRSLALHRRPEQPVPWRRVRHHVQHQPVLGLERERRLGRRRLRTDPSLPPLR